MRFDIAAVGGSDVLAGGAAGRKVCGALLAAAAEPEAPTFLIMDFDGVVVATTSFLREAVLRLRDAIRSSGSKLYPVVANANDDVREELGAFLHGRGEAVVVCRCDPDGIVTDAVLLGDLEPKQRRTLELLRTLGEADASSLARLDPDSEGVGVTAWNNRLAGLASKGFVLETQHGRAKRYQSIMEGI